ncbi:hypothetical protein [Paracoccus kondratievae]|uniref:Uncharacterized protein n=1 Tax=Paracoccus kondratievae TaxID=135740 RepID=A0AAD3RT60_9RHOB|nr:hypothetical protein [Paracoccus kondratievae]AZV00283.1 hypothetical protein pkon1_p54 [Paracoccus phage vB_PkoS_Pkon1]GLK63465.1 hypothetical protein GCM10017635_09350 [Paracoccus kondratievae]
MTDVNIATVDQLFSIALKAIEADEMEQLAALEKADLHAAYKDFKVRNGIDHIAIGTPEWNAMMDETKGEYDASEAARRKAYNAKRRLKSAIARYRAA